jgi:predicted O-linked N-acetylglucosamine transferase (SPINDLY family)
MSITAESNSLHDFWQAGIDHVLAGQNEEAQATWFLPFLDDELSISEEQLSQDLINYLSGSVNHKLSTGKLQDAYLIAQCLCTVVPDNLNALLQFLNLSIQTNEFTLDTLADPSLIAAFDRNLSGYVDEDIVYTFIKKIAPLLTTEYISDYINLIQILARNISDTYRFVCFMALQAISFGQELSLPHLRTKIMEICLAYSPVNLRFTILGELAESIGKEQDYNRAIMLGEQCKEEGEDLGLLQHVCGSHRLLTALMEAGEWQKILEVSQQHILLLEELVSDSSQNAAEPTICMAPYFLNYLYDEPRSLHRFKNIIGDMYSRSANLDRSRPRPHENHQFLPKNGLLRIGYLASNLNTHSVGWLSRWLFKYHDRSNFQIFIYHTGQPDNQPFNHRFFRDRVNTAYYLGANAKEIADLIIQDEIDILVDLDSITKDTSYEVMCLKPAPVSITWLGWDTSGCPEVDYFIADPHVLPPDAEEYYRTKIWRLPQTYIAIDGFEVEVPTKRRSDYQLSEDAIVYLCAQKSYKHHPDILRLQMQIIKQVPNSYLMVKLRANPDSLMRTYQELANEVGISMDQLRFIEPDPSEMTHRANLQLADVVLDTFPYNGATTTLETLWMGVPIVTKVGQAFVARNSYAFMQNVGVTEGIAYTDEEYVDWGVKLGSDDVLRQQIIGKLLNSRKFSPLWNARDFTQEMENAYRQMWEIYQQNQ